MILFDDQLFTFAWLCSKAVARCLPVTYEETGTGQRLEFTTRLADVKLHVDATEGAGVKAMQNCVMAYMVRGNPASAKKYYLDDTAQTQLVLHLANAWELFVLAHEYSHISMSHPLERRSLNFLEGNSLDALTTDWQHELEADRLGMRLTVLASESPTIAVLGATFYFACVELLERGLSYLRDGVDDVLPLVDNHPPPDLRRVEIHGYMHDFDVGVPISQGLVEVIERIVWPSMMVNIEMERATGVSPHAVWADRWPTSTP